MLINCPHCYKKVLPLQDERCPGCGKNTKDLTGIIPDIKLIEIHQGTNLPQICCLCGKESEGTVLVRRSKTSSGESLFIRILILIFSPVLFIFSNGFSRKKARLQISLPVCSKCNCDNIEPRHVDFDNFTMTFALHKNFRESLIEQDKV